MNITLNQSEIEAAIVQYIGGQMTIANGMEISIKLKATRGDEGHTAFIDIRPSKGSVKQEILASTAAQNLDQPAAAAASPRKAPAIEAAPVEEEKGTDEPEADTADEDSAEVAEETSEASETEAVEEPAAAPAPEVVEETKPKLGRPPGRSLFGGMKQKPSTTA